VTNARVTVDGNAAKATVSLAPRPGCHATTAVGVSLRLRPRRSIRQPCSWPWSRPCCCG